MKKFIPRLVLLLLLCTFFLRVFNFSQIQFDSDFGRDSLFAWRILHEKPTLLGAQASVGGFYLGPLYFYAIAGIFSVFGPLPEMIMLFFALLNVLAAWIGWKLLSQKINLTAGFIFLILFAFSPMLIAASRGATHMPMLPIITIAGTALLVRALTTRKLLDHFVCGLVFGLFLHVHFSALLLFPGYLAAVFFLSKGSFGERLKYVLVHILALALMASPLIFFDLRHGFITSRAFFGYIESSILGRGIRENFPHWTLAQKLEAITQYVGQNLLLRLLIVSASVAGFIGLVRSKTKSLLVPIVLFLFVSMSLLLFLYHGYLFSYYMIVPGTLVILVASVMLSKIKPVISIGLALAASLLSLSGLTSIYLPQYRTVTNLVRVVSVIEQREQVLGKPAFEVFKDSSDGLTGLAYEYRFLLTRDGYIPVSEYAYDQASVLYVIAENGPIDPVKLGNYEVTQFHPLKAAKISSQQISGQSVDIYELTR